MRFAKLCLGLGFGRDDGGKRASPVLVGQLLQARRLVSQTGEVALPGNRLRRICRIRIGKPLSFRLHFRVGVLPAHPKPLLFLLLAQSLRRRQGMRPLGALLGALPHIKKALQREYHGHWVALRLGERKSSVDRMAAQTPSRKYRIERYLAEGGMGAIYVGKKIGPGGFEKEVVLKQLLPEFTSRPEFRDLFFREAKISATLDHQNIVRTFDLVNSNERLFIVMEYVRGADLRTIAWRARRRKPLSVPAILHVAIEILAGLGYAHGRRSPSGEPLGIIHRDLSPSNILCSGEGEVKLSDFGIAKAATYSSVFYRVRGKVGYMSPEMARNQPIDARSDLFSLGVSIYETLIGERIYTGDLNTPPDKIYAQVVPRLEAKCPGLPPELQTVLDRALAIDRNDRYPNAESLAIALRQVAIDHHLLYSAPELAVELRQTMGATPEHWLSDQRDLSGIRNARAAQAQDALAGNEANSVVEPDAPPASRTGDSDVDDVATPPARPSASMAARKSAPLAAVPARPSGSMAAVGRPLAPITALPPPLPKPPMTAAVSAPPSHDPTGKVTPPPPAPLPPAVSMLERPYRSTQLPFGLRQVHDVLRTGGVAAARRSFRGIWLALLVVLAVLLGFALVRFVIAPSVWHAQGGSAPVGTSHRQQSVPFGHGHAVVLAQDHFPPLAQTQYPILAAPVESL